MNRFYLWSYKNYRLKSSPHATYGFTLIELTVVMGIVGILSAVALPNYRKFVRKARFTEAKLALSGVYVAEASFRAQYNSYTACLSQAGFTPLGTHRFYGVGFSVSGATLPLLAPEDGCAGLNGKVPCNSLEIVTGNPGSVCTTVDATFGPPTTASDINFMPNTKAGTISSASLNGALLSSGGPLWDSFYIMVARGSVSDSSPFLNEWILDSDKNIYPGWSGADN